MRSSNLILYAALLLSTSATANVGERSKTIDQSFHVNDHNFYMEVDNKYGDIQIIPWDKDSIRVVAEVTVRSEKHERLPEMLDRIHVNIQKTHTFLLVQTQWDSDVSFFKQTTYNLNQRVKPSDRVVINQTIYLPADLSLEIRNRFGNVFMSDHRGELNVSVSHGDFRARKLVQLEELEVKFGRVKIKSLNDSRLSFQSVSSAKIDKVNKLNLTSSSSDVELKLVGELLLSSRHDEIHIDQVKKVQGTASLSDLSVDLITDQLDISSKNGSVHIDQTSPGTREVRLHGNKTDITLGLSESFVGDFRIDVDNKCRFIYSGRINVKSKGVDSEGRQFLNGSLGGEALTRVVVTAEGGFLEMSDR